MLCVCGLEEIHREKMLIMMLPKSVSRCAASVMMARLPAAYPPAETRDGDCRLSTEGRICVRELRGEGLCTFYCDFLLNPVTNTNQDLFSLSSCLNKRSWASQITTVFQINSLTGFIRLFDPRIVLPFTTLLLSSFLTANNA